MMRFGSAIIDDLDSMRIQCWDNSFLIMKSGYLVGVKVLMETEIDWLSTPSKDEKIIVESANEDEKNLIWDTVIVPNQSNYINISLYFVSHLDSDILLESVGKVGPLKLEWTQELSDILEHLAHMKASKMDDLRWLSLTPIIRSILQWKKGQVSSYHRKVLLHPLIYCQS